jgi:hypothetical protein
MNPPLAHCARWCLVLAVGLFGLAVGGCNETGFTVPGLNQGYKPEQPIPYSHKQHAGDLKIDCKYCHFGSEQSPRAGIPPVNVCMNCHKLSKPDSPYIKKLKEAYDTGKSFEWVRVHKLPDFVWFDHSRHVNRGVACQTCHGPVQEMVEMYQYSSLAMGWCVNCHREYNKNPPAGLKDKIQASTDCYSCHH